MQHARNLFPVLFDRLLADLGPRARAEPAGKLLTDLDLYVGLGVEERLRVGVDRDELDPFESRSSIMRLTALPPPPPTPTTFMRAF